MSKHRILLADDSVTIQKVVNLTFADEGIEVITAGDGNTAMQKFVESTPDLVMVDVNMPGFDGYRICEMIKGDEETKQIPVILLVGSFEPFDEAEAKRVGADDYLTKPFQSIRQLVSKVSDLLAHTGGDNSIYNQANAVSEDIKTKAAANSLDDNSKTPDEFAFVGFEAGMDDEMIQTNQIGSLPADETQKFVFEPNFQTSENNLASAGTGEKEDSTETQPPHAEDFDLLDTDSSVPKTSQFDEKIFEFADEPPFAQEIKPDVSERKMQEAPAKNDDTLDIMDSKMTTQPQNDSFFDFDDLNLLDLPPLAKKPLSRVETAKPAAKTPEVSPESRADAGNDKKSDSAALGDLKDLTQADEKKDSVETSQFPPEVIEAITKRIMEKLSDKIVKEVAREITPQMTESIIKEMTRNKMNNG